MSFESQSFGYPSADYLASTLVESRPMYARRRSQFKSTALPVSTAAPRNKYKRVIRNRRRRFVGVSTPVGGNLTVMDPTIVKLNRFKPAPVTFEKTSPAVFTLGPSTAASAWSLIFDPSGTYNTFAGSSTGSLGTMPDWSSLTAIYNLYRVRKIVVTFRAETTGSTVSSLDDDSLGIVERYNYEKSVVTPTAAGISQLTEAQSKKFTSQHPQHQYTIYPKACYEVQNSAILASQGVSLMPQRWTDVNFPCQLYGFQWAMTNATNAQTQMYIDITYVVDFKYNK